MTFKGPLGGVGEAEAETDVIFTAVLVGFALTRTLLRQPFSFDAPHDHEEAELTRLERTVEQVAALIASSGIAGAEHCPSIVRAGVSPEHSGQGDALITGSRGGEALEVYARNRVMSDPEAVAMAIFEYESAGDGAQEFAGQYHGRGAYTGMVDDVVTHHTMIQPTLRRTIDDPGRWQPDRDGLWGLIGSQNQTLTDPTNPAAYANLATDPRTGMGPMRKSRGIVQYIHGMSWAMREAQRWGPWTTAYEMAVGEETKKRASCFACTTYMWSSGFPASSTHLGRCESWGTLPDGSFIDSEDHEFSDGSEGELERATARSMNHRWHLDMYHQMRQGLKLLRQIRSMPVRHRSAVDRLSNRLDQSDAGDAITGGKLFLDAITWHRPDIDRVSDVFGL